MSGDAGGGARRTLRARLVVAVVAVACAVIGVAALLWAYAPALSGPFLWDDHALIEQDGRVATELLSPVQPPVKSAPAAMFYAPFWPERGNGDALAVYFRPLVTWSYALNARAARSPRSFHETNLVLHLLTALIVALLAARAARVSRTGARVAIAAAAAMVWASAPRSTEVVAWISGRTDGLAALFGLAAVLVWPSVARRAGSGLTVRMYLSSALMLLGLLAKESAYAVPCALLLAESCAAVFADPRVSLSLSPSSSSSSSSRMSRRALRFALPLASLATYAALRFGALRATRLPPAYLRSSPFEVVGRYVQMILDPWQPRMPIGVPGIPDRTLIAVGAATSLAFAGLLVWTFYQVRARGDGRRPLDPETVLWVALAALAIVPTLQIVPLPLGVVAADRFLYLPLAALVVLLAKGISALDARARARGPASPASSVVAFAAAAVLAILVVSQLAVTRARAANYGGDELTFWITAATEADPRNTLPLATLSSLPTLAERPDVRRAVTRSVSAVLEATGRTDLPIYRRARGHEIAALVDLGDFDGAVVVARSLAARFPDNGAVAAERGYAEMHAEHFGLAHDAFARAVALDGDLKDARRMAALTATWTDASLATHASYRAAVFLGRRTEACDEARVAAFDPAIDDENRRIALDFVIAHDEVHAARAAYTRFVAEAPHGSPLPESWETTLRAREAARAAVDRAAPTILRLAAR